MIWPFVSRKKYEQRCTRVAELYARWLAKAAECQSLERELFELQGRFDHMRALEQDERWRRLKAEGLARFKDDRIRAALALIHRPEAKKTG